MYLLFKKWAFEVKNCGKYTFEYSREHRQQRWYATVMHNEEKVMNAINIMDEAIDASDRCLFDAFLAESVPALESYLEEMKNGRVEEVSENQEQE